MALRVRGDRVIAERDFGGEAVLPGWSGID
jgi:hypothetical protein